MLVLLSVPGVDFLFGVKLPTDNPKAESVANQPVYKSFCVSSEPKPIRYDEKSLVGCVDTDKRGILLSYVFRSEKRHIL